MKLYTLMSPKVIASITFDLAVQIHTTEVQLFMYQNQSERYLKVFCINRTANVCYDFIRIKIQTKKCFPPAP